MSYFNSITNVLVRKLCQLEQLRFNPDNGFLFGFSFGSVLCLEAGYRFGPQKLYRVDVCDQMGAFYDQSSDPVKHGNLSAKHVVCTHTSNDFGTSLRLCSIDIDMGNCGMSQPAAMWVGDSHKLCPVFYRNAFENKFKVVPKPSACVNQKVVPDVTVLPPNTFGYFLNVNLQAGQYYVLTSMWSPYNVL